MPNADITLFFIIVSFVLCIFTNVSFWPNINEQEKMYSNTKTKKFRLILSRSELHPDVSEVIDSFYISCVCFDSISMNENTACETQTATLDFDQ